jgi:hypothetical protein
MNRSDSYKSFMKSPHKSSKHSTYFDVYDDLLGKFRGKEITFVEVGVSTGGSLFMWRDFFGPQARIIGIDLNPNAKKWEHDGFEIYIGSQADEKFWEDFKREVGAVDILLDDGGHTYAQQIITAEMMLGAIKDGGLLIVEDTHTSYMRGFGPRKYSFIAYAGNMVDKINSRFSHLRRNGRVDTRVWSIRFFESFVVFYVDRELSGKLSSEVNNEGLDDQAYDYRYGAQKTLKKRFNKFMNQYFPGFLFTAKKYFKA